MTSLIPSLDDFLHVSDTLAIDLVALKEAVPDIETAVFFAAALDLSLHDTSCMLERLFPHESVVRFFTEGDHSTTLQQYIVDPQYVPGVHDMPVSQYVGQPPQSVLLTHLLDYATTPVGSSIAEVASSIGTILSKFPHKAGNMSLRHLANFNHRRNQVGSFSATIQHQPEERNLVILDDSGSMGPQLIQAIADEVVALSYSINATLVLVSNTARRWAPGAFTTASVLEHTQFGGTYYEELQPVLNESWDRVVTIADFDSSGSAADYLRRKAKGSIGTIYDVSLVNRPTFLSIALNHLASKRHQIFLANSYSPINN